MVQQPSGRLSVNQLLEEIPEPGMQRRALSSGLVARDQVACVTQASAKGREAQHDKPTLRHSPAEVKCDISLSDDQVQ
jgi:hypothetical protein